MAGVIRVFYTTILVPLLLQNESGDVLPKFSSISPVKRCTANIRHFIHGRQLEAANYCRTDLYNNRAPKMYTKAKEVQRRTRDR
ncbi:hypothetical protein ABW21_db0209463 [Orbilia brochopaga]|nr:hypothetical protein ABW21_db0209463 [Drechslerella brochopaga]